MRPPDPGALRIDAGLTDELYEAAFDFACYDDLRGELCEHCRPDEPAAFLAARDRLADAIDNVKYAREIAAEYAEPAAGAPQEAALHPSASPLYVCEKCGYSGATSQHQPCNYLAWRAGDPSAGPHGDLERVRKLVARLTDDQFVTVSVMDLRALLVAPSASPQGAPTGS